MKTGMNPKADPKGIIIIWLISSLSLNKRVTTVATAAENFGVPQNACVVASQVEADLKDVI